MKPTTIPGVYQDNKKLYTINPTSCQGLTIYNEHLYTRQEIEYRSWSPYRSKLAAAFLKKLPIPLAPNNLVLYLGAATGTTVSHVSDILTQGQVYAVENSPIAMNKLLEIIPHRPNIIPIFADAFHPERYHPIVSPVDFLYQDISQRNQADIFLSNIHHFLKPYGTGLIMVKARSIDVSLQPSEVYNLVVSKLKQHHIKIQKQVDLAPYEKDHAALLITKEK